MKKIIKSALLVLCSVCLLTACEDDRDSNPTLQKPTDGSLVLNTPGTANIDCDLANSTVLNFTLKSVPNYGFPAYTNYDMEVSLNSDMSNAEVIATTSSTKIEVDAALLASTLTTMECDKGKTEADFPMTIPVYFRVRSNAMQNAGGAIDGYETISNIVSMNKIVLAYSLVEFLAVDIHLHFVCNALFVRCKEVEFLFVDIIDTLKLCSLVDRPAQGAHLDLEFLFQFVEQVKGVTSLTVHLIDEDDDGRLSHATDGHQFACLRLYTLGTIHHDNG